MKAPSMLLLGLINQEKKNPEYDKYDPRLKDLKILRNIIKKHTEAVFEPQNETDQMLLVLAKVE